MDFGLWTFLLALVSLPLSGATIRTWDGGATGGNGLWSNVTNWSSNIGPAVGNELVFPTGVAKLAMTNDFAAAPDFAGISISNSYALSGNAIGLSNLLHVAASGSTGQIDAPLSIAGGCRFIADANTALTLSNLALNAFGCAMTAEGDITIAGVISGSGAAGIVKDGVGTLTLAGANTYTGVTTVNAGTLLVNGTAADVALGNGAILAGNGTIGALTTGGFTSIRPGNVNSVGVLSVAGLMNLSSNTTLEIILNSATPGLGYDQLRCLSPLNLASAHLDIVKSLVYFPPTNTTFVILSNTTASAIIGTFAGLPNGAVTNVSGVDLQINYVGGNGNDVTLTVVGVTRTWDGGALADPNWSNALNWNANLLPLADYGLTFPRNVPGRTNFNDFTNGFPLHHITIGQSNYVIQGANELLLRNYLEATNDAGSVEFFPPLRAGLNQMVIANRPGGTLNLHGLLRCIGADGVFAAGGLIVPDGGITNNQTTFKRGSGTLRLGTANYLGGTLQIEEGAVQMRHDHALDPVAALVAVSPGGRLELHSGRILSNSVSLGGAIFGGGGGASNRVAGPVSLDGLDAPATIEAAENSYLTVAANVSGSQGLTKLGAGTLELSAANDYTGPTFINQGTVLVTGSAASSMSVANGTLAGVGTIASLTNRAGGTVLPGRINTPGRLSVLNSVTLEAGSTVRFRLNGTTPVSGYSQLSVSAGAVALNGAALECSIGFVPAFDATFVIIDNTGSGATTGAFAGLPQKAMLTNDGMVFRISYSAGSGNDVALTFQGFAQPTNLHVFDGPAGRRVALQWTASFAASEYIVYRNGCEIKRGTPDAFGPQLIAEDLHILPGHTYTYQVVAVDTNGSLSLPSNEILVTAPALPPKSGTNQVVTVLLRFADFPQTPFPTSQVNALMFTASNSVKRYLEEVSYGQFTIEGSTHGWYTLPHAASSYCSTQFPNGLWYSCAIPLADIYSVLPPAVSNLVQAADQVQFAVHGLGTVGEAGGKFAFYSATNGFGPGTIIHELGHTLGFLHASSLIQCDGYALGPDLVRLRTNDCFTLLYGDLYDPMGGGSTFHYNAYFKERAGWLATNNIQWVTADGDYTLNAIESPTNGVQMLKIDLGCETFWFLEYRTRTGMDGTNSPSLDSAPIDGVLMHLRVSRMILADWDTFWIQPVVRTNTPWFDPFSGLCVNVLSQSGGAATVRITGLRYLLRITGARRVGVGGKDLLLTWDSVPGARYLVQGSTNLTDWVTLQTSVDATNRTATTVINDAVINDFRVFRVGVDTGP